MAKIASRYQYNRDRRRGVVVPADMPQEYMILDPHHQPDLRGHFAGQPVYYRGGCQYVRLTEAQARFYMDQGAIKLATS